MSSQPTERSFGVIPVYRKDGQTYFLLIRHNSGHWAFPKGHAEPGESEMETAQRELWEETGIRDVTIYPQPVFEERYTRSAASDPHQTVAKTVRYFLGIVRDPRVRLQAAEVQDYRWATLDEARATITYETGRRLVEQAAQALERQEHWASSP
ncbi:MAG: NUDIX domain-containing protein [Thermoflexales bacterium]|nr:NUDIX domain-containing protein [Thermoflexales bacterium]MDW8351255.1 NUDIX domain-containing protein [Anaerolineae bacterium]